jgi:hypothetical protein
MSNTGETMQEEIYKHKLDLYYLAAIGYVVTFVVYVAVRGSMVGDTFEVVWRDPIVYLLALCSLLALIGVALAAILARRVIIGEKQLTFRSRFKERVFLPENIEWIAFHRERPLTTRGERAYPTARIKLRNKRRRLRLRPGGFERSAELTAAIRAWAERNGVLVRKKGDGLRRRVKNEE